MSSIGHRAIETNLHIAEYLDIMFDLKTGKYYLQRKQNNSSKHIHKQCNHPPSIIKQIPSMISNKKLPDISNEKKHFNKSAPAYNQELKNDG